MNEITGLLLLLLIFFFWYRNLSVRELAMKHSTRACQEQSFQLLDGSVHLSGIRPARCPGQNRCLRRRYRFTYSSDHVNRSNGVTIMLGNQLESIVFSPPVESI